MVSPRSLYILPWLALSSQRYALVRVDMGVPTVKLDWWWSKAIIFYVMVDPPISGAYDQESAGITPQRLFISNTLDKCVTCQKLLLVVQSANSKPSS
jgi:hypothetical protein